MKKTRPRKLALHRETLRQMEQTTLHHAAGGLTPACPTAKCNTEAGCNTASVCDPKCTDYTQIGTCTC